MRKTILAAGLCVAALTPSVASAESCESQRSGRVAATIGGAVVGGVLGNVIAGRGDNTEGTIIGGVLGGIAGNQIGKSDNDCRRAYGWYDKQGRWHATGVASADARGYYDINGDWVAGAPTGYYDGNRWVSYDRNVRERGYYDRDGYWVPNSVGGYYDRNGRWVEARRYDNNGYANAMPRDVRARIDWMENWVRDSRQRGALTRREADRALTDLRAIRSSERVAARNRNGNLTVRSEAALQVRLDRLSDRLRISTNQAYRN